MAIFERNSGTPLYTCTIWYDIMYKIVRPKRTIPGGFGGKVPYRWSKCRQKDPVWTGFELGVLQSGVNPAVLLGK